MSHAASKWAWDQLQITGSEKLVLLRLADHADPNGGSVHPGIASVARFTGLSERQVQRYIAGFLKRGILAVEDHPKGGRGHTTGYYFPIVKGDTSDTVSQAKKGDVGDTQRVTPVTPIPEKRVTPMTLKGDTHDAERVTSSAKKPTDTFKEPSIEPSGTVIVQPPKKRGSQIPAEFDVSDAVKTWAAKEGIPEAALYRQLPQFIDHYIAKGETRKDWDASFRTWMRNAREWGHLTVHHGGNARASPGRRGYTGDELLAMSRAPQNDDPDASIFGDVIDVKGRLAQ